MSDRQFLGWLRDRMVYVYGESPNVDFVHRLNEIINAQPSEPCQMTTTRNGWMYQCVIPAGHPGGHTYNRGPVDQPGEAS